MPLAKSKKMAAKKPATKTKTAKHAPVKSLVGIKPKIRIQRVAGLAPNLPTNKEMVVDLKKSMPVAPPLGSRTPTVLAKPAPTADKSFYSDEEDDSLEPSLNLPASKSQQEEDGDLDDDLSLPEYVSGKDKQAAPDYASLDNKERKPKDGGLDRMYSQSGKDSLREQPSLDNASVGVYKKLAITFVFLVAVIGLAVFYFAAVKTNILISLKNEQIKDRLTVTVVDGASQPGLNEPTVSGLVKEIAVEQSKVYTISGTEVIGTEVFGKVTLISTNNKSQPLVANTRLLSASGKLYRLKNSVNIPAGGQIEAEVFADNPIQENVVGAEKFTIPGLWAGLQDKIYAMSKEGDIHFGQQTKNTITQEQLDQSVANLKQEVADKAQADVDNTYSDFNKRLVTIVASSTTSTIDSKVGEEKDRFTVTVKATVQVVAFKDADFKALAEKAITAALPTDKKLVALDNSSLDYQLVKFDAAAKRAEIEMSMGAEVTLVQQDNIIDKKKIINLKEDQLKLYLASQPLIKDFQLQFSPSFIRKTPGLVDRITVQIIK
ncbi:MAG: hypothetical protein WCO55_03775 [Candidatus Falkowbacteria bacterium]